MPQLPKFADWTPPWGKDNDDIDADKAARYIHGLLSDKETLQVKVDEAATQLTEVKGKLDEANTALTAAQASGADEKLATANTKVADLETKLKAASTEALRLKVALDEGLTAVQAKRLIGDTEAELKADAADLLESFGGAGAKPGDGDDDEDDDDDTQVPTRTPRRLNNPADKDRDLGTSELTQAQIDKHVFAMSGGSFI